MTARPIITMDETSEEVWATYPDQPSKPIYLGYLDGDRFRLGHLQWLKFAEVRALADFLDQLAGANLLSGVAGGDDE